MGTSDRARSSDTGLVARAGPLLGRYARDDLAVFSSQERRALGIGDSADPSRDASLAWELLYRLEPDLYEHLVSAERLHPGILEWLPARVDRIVEIGAGTGRLTLELVSRCRSLTAIEPAAPLRDLLKQQLDRRLPAHAFSRGPAIQVINGFFDALPLPDRSAELVIACSALTADASHGGQRGLAEMERVCTPEGLVVIVWPNNVQWLQSRGYRYRSFPGRMAMHFASVAEAVELASVFYPKAAERVRRLGNRVVPYEWLGVNPPRDLAYKLIA